jgi:uncharacterized membrane protein YedE/YeeE
MRNLFAALSGIVFGVGLGVAQMVNPEKIRNFLDITGTWDPSLAFVMGGALVMFFLAWQFSLRRTRPLFDVRFYRPQESAVWDARMLSGAAVFGIGWGLVGFCPGPAITALAFLTPQAAIFVSAMVAGSWLAGRLGERSAGEAVTAS